MPCTITLSTIPGRKTPFGMTLALMGKSLDRKTIEVVSTVNDIKSAVADFGKSVHQAHPNESFYISVSIAKGCRKPNGYDAATKNDGLGQATYMKMGEPERCTATN
jgi:murein tripeptide amidase MpaA